MFRLYLIPVLAVLLAHPAVADTGGTPQSMDQRHVNFRVDGGAIHYDTEAEGATGEITEGDVETFLDLMRGNPDVVVLVLNSTGGSVWAGDEMARIAIDFGLDTRVEGECSSSCVPLFLAGAKRSMARGSKIGFHSRTWSPSAVEGYYTDAREDYGWTTPFDFASWVYTDTQSEVYNSLAYIVSRGVRADFAIEMHAPRSKVWFPTRDELIAGGVLTE